MAVGVRGASTCTRAGAGNFASSRSCSGFSGGLHFDVNSLAALELGGEVLRRIDGGNLALVDDDHAVTGHADFGQDVRGKNDGVRARQALDQVAHFDDLLGIEADGGLVEDDHVGIVHQRLGQAHALLVAARKPLDQLIALIGDVGFFERLGDARGRFSAGTFLMRSTKSR